MRPMVAGHGGRVWVTCAMGLGHAVVLWHAVWASPRHPGKWGHVDVLQTSWGGCRSMWLDVTGWEDGQWMRDACGVAPGWRHEATSLMSLGVHRMHPRW